MKSTVSSKGQVTVPKAVRDQLHLRAGDQIEFVTEADGAVRVVPITLSVTALKGMVPRPKRPLTLEEMEVAVAKGAAGQ